MRSDISRRSLLKALSAAVGGALFSNKLFSMDNNSAPQTGLSSDIPRPGGILRAAFNGKLDGAPNVLYATHSPFDYVRARLIWDTLADSHGGNIEWRLIKSAEPDATSTRWTLKVRPGVTFSDGRRLTAKDVLYSLHALASHPSAQSGWLQPLDSQASRIENDETLTLVLKEPVGAFDWRLSQGMFVFPDGTTDFQQAPGTGAWTLFSTNDNVCTLRPRKDYWDNEGKAWLDEIHLYAIADVNARVNGLKAGQFDYAGGVTLMNARSEQNNPAVRVITAPKEQWNSLAFSMNLSQAPFDRAQVAEALKLSIDRESMVRLLSFGMGEVANDTLGAGQQWHHDSLPCRTYDPEQARALLQQAGIAPEIAIRTSNYVWGLAESATLLLRQAKPAGFNLTLNKLPVADYYSNIPELLNAPIKTNLLHSMPLPVALPFYYGKKAPYSYTGPASPQLDALMQTMQAAQRDAITPAIHNVQEYLYFHGGDAIFARLPSVALCAPGVGGIQAAGFFDYPLLRSAWLAR